jgi:DNA-binding Lrp family transcriptional regulator
VDQPDRGDLRWERPVCGFGDPDYLLRVVTRDLPDFQRVYDDRLATLPGIQRLSSTLVMKTVVENRPLPL